MVDSSGDGSDQIFTVALTVAKPEISQKDAGITAKTKKNSGKTQGQQNGFGGGANGALQARKGQSSIGLSTKYFADSNFDDLFCGF